MKTTLGKPTPLGFSIRGNIAQFALFSSHAEKVILGLFDKESNPVKEFPLNQTGDVWHIGIENLPPDLEYAYRCDGPVELLYDPQVWLMDPYAKIIRGERAMAALPPPFDWQNDQPPHILYADLVIYEMHVRGFTKHASSGVAHPGTYLGMIEKIPYLKKLGINALELMPIFGFDQTYTKHKDENLVNYWGYNPLHFFAPMNWYATSDAIKEFKTLVRELHKQGFEVLLDVVFNHTGEEDNRSYYVSFRGIDNSVYYLVDKKGTYLNFTGCGNTINANHPIVQNLIIDSLRYWIEEMHVDGFRFDLASIFTRGPMGDIMNAPPILDRIKNDPVISKVKLIAEAWDASGLYQLGYFAKQGLWSEWNGHYRDILRRFIKGTDAKAAPFASVISGSEKIYKSSKTPLSSINFITAHDGFSLRDLVTYQNKHNFSNKEKNCDGNNQNDSWNCGHEGPTDDPAIKALRERQMRNFFLALFLSQGIPMLLMGDEYGHTREGNNNPYVQDNEINWFLWDKQDPKMFQFVSELIAFRLKHSNIRKSRFLTDADVTWFSQWDTASRLVAYRLKGNPDLYIAFNANYESATIQLPTGNWSTIINTSEEWLFHTHSPPISSIELAPYSAFLAIQLS